MRALGLTKINGRQAKWTGLILAAAVVAAQTALAQTYTVLYTFNVRGGNYPMNAGVILDSAGNLYGTAYLGAKGYGVVYELDTSDTEQVLYAFPYGANGAFPQGGLTRDSAGNLYGVAHQGGIFTGACQQGIGCGLVYKVDASGTETVLYSFTGGTDGELPSNGVILDPAGNLYGTSAEGSGGGGVVFELDTAGTLTPLYSCTGGADGGGPNGPLLRDATGNLYGTAGAGGAFNQGVVFRVDTSGKETVLYSFTGGADGVYPSGGLIQDADGNLYATAASGGITTGICAKYNPAGCGVVFVLDKTGQQSVLYSFTGESDGWGPSSGVIRDAAGNLYGTTGGGGGDTSTPCAKPVVEGCGTVFELDTAGNKTILHAFTGIDGRGPAGSLIQDSAGNLYGTTDDGGDDKHHGGVIYKITP